MRILIVSEPGVFGSVRCVLRLVEYLLEQKQEVHLAYSDRRASDRLWRLVAIVTEHGGECLNLRVGNAPEPGDLLALWRLRALVGRVRPEVIHAHSSKAGALVRLLPGLGVRAHLFYTPHGYFGFAPRAGALPYLFNVVERLLSRVGTTVTTSQDERLFGLAHIGVPPEKMRAILNPECGPSFHPPSLEERRAARAELGLPPDALVLGMMGRLTFQKNPVALYRALGPVFAAHPELMLYHLGPGELEEEVQAAARAFGRRVIRCATLDRPVSFYQAIDALALTSRYEGGWPLVVLEGLATGLPLITTIVPGMSEIGAVGLSHCWAVPVDDPAALTKALLAWVEDRPRRRPSNHRQMVLERHSPGQTLDTLLALYQTALSGRAQ